MRSIDMERLIQNGSVDELEESGQYLKGSIKIKDLLEDSEEYLLVLHVELENFDDVQYYTRIKNGSYDLLTPRSSACSAITALSCASCSAVPAKGTAHFLKAIF